MWRINNKTLSYYLFETVIGKIIRLIHDEIPLCVLYVDDIELMDATKDVVNTKLRQWRQTLESKGLG